MREILPINLSDYNYFLPDGKIALYPAERRDSAKLLVCHSEIVFDSKFSSIDEFIPRDSLLVLNDTRVIHARLLFEKQSGAAIEIFCLEPEAPYKDIQLAMQEKESCVWNCMVGNAKKWKSGKLKMALETEYGSGILSAEVVEKNDSTFLIKFIWNLPGLTFSEVIEKAGKVPLPPYIHREAEDDDSKRYQTVFAVNDGSVAAPTAGLHFTKEVFNRLDKKKIQIAHLTLHVGAGTFKPVTADLVQQHVMHAEQVMITKKLIEDLLQSNNTIAVGTTSVRSLESLYWLGAKYISTGVMPTEVNQWDAYETEYRKPPTDEVLNTLLDYLKKHRLSQLHFRTSLIIIPGYNFRIIRGMVTNFHQPKSTLLLLISAFLGPKWKYLYEHALNNNYRFLSYGDACLFLR